MLFSRLNPKLSMTCGYLVDLLSDFMPYLYDNSYITGCLFFYLL